MAINNFIQADVFKNIDLLKLIFDSIRYGVVVTDENGYVIFLNKPYGNFLGVKAHKQIGKHVEKVIQNTRMHLVAKTGVAEINQIQKCRGQDIIVDRIPIKKNGKVVAVFGQVVFRDAREVSDLFQKISFLESKINFYENYPILLSHPVKLTFDNIIGVSNKMVLLKVEAQKAASTNLPILITSESGTGKELFAKAIHYSSPHKLSPLVVIDCATIPKDLLEAELFGYEKGAFTGASSSGKQGKLELANHGTLFLDEIGDLPLEMQPKLLRVLEEKTFTRVGGTTNIKSDFRLISATNQNLEEMISCERFRNDLFFRINVIPLLIPPLRERREDILPLVHYILNELSSIKGLKIKIEPAAEKALKNYSWPGNVRELFNVLQRILYSLDGNTIRFSDLPSFIYNQPKVKNPLSNKALKESANTLKDSINTKEQQIITDALKASDFNKVKAANLLGIHRTLLYKKIKKYNICMT
jgi:transcriptional regulator with PAS, ATPase and Fis domain